MAKNDCVVAINANHACCSGGYAAKYIKLCTSEPKIIFPDGNPTKVATPLIVTYKDLIIETKKLNPFFSLVKMLQI